MVNLVNIPKKAKEKNLQVFVKKYVEGANKNTVKVNIDRDNFSHKSLSRAWIVSSDKSIVIRLLNLHFRVILINS